MNAFSEDISQFGFMGSMFSLCNMVSVVISSTLMSYFSKCLSTFPFLKKIPSLDKLKRMNGIH